MTTDLKTHARHLRDASRRIGSGSKEKEPDLDAPTEALLEKTRGICAHLGELRIDPTGEPPLAGIAAAIGKAEEDASALTKLLSDAEAKYDVPKEGVPAPRPGAYRHNPFRDRRIYVQRLAHALGGIVTSSSARPDDEASPITEPRSLRRSSERISLRYARRNAISTY